LWGAGAVAGGAFSRQTIENLPAVIFYSEAFVWVFGQLPWWNVYFCFCILSNTCEGVCCAGLLHGPVVVEILTEGIGLG